jgi:hypothetical protein
VKATVYNNKKELVAEINDVEIVDESPAGKSVKFSVPGHLGIGDYILFLEDGRRIGFPSWSGVFSFDTQRTHVYSPLVPTT